MPTRDSPDNSSGTPTKEYPVSVVGLELLAHDLNKQGLSRQMFDNICQGLIKNWKFQGKKTQKAGKAKAASAKTGSDNVRNPVAQEPSKKVAEKLSGLKKLAVIFKFTVPSSYEEYLKSDGRAEAEKLFKGKMDELSQDIPEGGKLGPKLAEWLENVGLTKSEINASRSYFPEFKAAKPNQGNGGAPQ